MLTIKQISEIISKTAQKYDIKKVTLFGSYADGRNTAQSDIDLFVEFYTETYHFLHLHLYGTDNKRRLKFTYAKQRAYR